MSDEAVAKRARAKKARTPKADKAHLAEAARLEAPMGAPRAAVIWHRAGLAGLALCVKFLKRRPDQKGVCEIEGMDDQGLTLVVDRAGMQSLFDDVYDATIEEALSKAKWPGAEAKRIDEVHVKDEKTGKTRNEKRFVYDRVVPGGSLIAEWDGALPSSPKPWLKLWRDLVWSTLRGVPAQR